MNHYEKYKITIKEGVKKSRRKRDIWINEYLPTNHVYTVGNRKRVPWSSSLTTKKSESFQDQKDSEKNSDFDSGKDTEE